MSGYGKLTVASMIGVLVAGAMGGCRTVEPGVEMRMGTLRTVVAASPDEVISAAEQAVDDLDLILVSSTASRMDGELVARTADDEQVTISSEHHEPGESTLSIRVGRLGDESVSRQIHRAVMEHLGEEAARPRGIEQPDERQEAPEAEPAPELDPPQRDEGLDEPDEQTSA